jgi:hypothetical protein
MPKPNSTAQPRKVFTFDRDGKPLRFTVRRLLIAGFTGRDPAAVQHHVEELAKEGVPAPKRVPDVFVANPATLQIGGTVWAYDGKSSGEIEYVLLIGRSDVYVCLGSDHTDRGLEALSIDKSKQVYPRVLSRQAWRLEELLGRWDELNLASRVGGEGGLSDYQRGTLGNLIRPEKLLKLIGPAASAGTAVFSGTLPVVGGSLRYEPLFEGKLSEPCGRTLATLTYRTGVLAPSPLDG